MQLFGVGPIALIFVSVLATEIYAAQSRRSQATPNWSSKRIGTGARSILIVGTRLGKNGVRVIMAWSLRMFASIVTWFGAKNKTF
jgi:hypothetical protein